MASYRTLTAAFVAPVLFFLTIPVAPASAQEIGVWGMWGNWNNEQGRRHRSGRRYRAEPGYTTYNSATARESDTPNKGRIYPALLTGGPQPTIDPATPDIIDFPNSEEVGTVIIDTKARRLYYTLNDQEAFAYPISVGRQGYTWTGTEQISRVANWPDWHPPKEMREREPGLPVKMTGGLRNPLGAVAIYLGDTLYRIHGTNDPKTIGRAASSGCIRMLNRHVVHLSNLVYVGSTVKVVASIKDLDGVDSAELQTTRAGG